MCQCLRKVVVGGSTFFVNYVPCTSVEGLVIQLGLFPPRCTVCHLSLHGRRMYHTMHFVPTSWYRDRLQYNDIIKVLYIAPAADPSPD